MSPNVRMPTGVDANRAAATRDLLEVLEALSCAARLLTRPPASPRDLALADAILSGVVRAKDGVRRLKLPSRSPI